MAKRKKETKRRLFGMFGKKDEPEAAAPQQPPAGQPEASPSDEDVWHKPPEHSGETGHVQFGSGQVPEQGGGDLFNFSQPDPLLEGGGDPGELTMAPGYAQPGGMDPSQMTIPPNYTGDGGAGPGGDEPAFDPGELTMAPGYALPGGGSQPPAASPPSAAEPTFDASEMTMVPGYAQPGAQPPVKVPPADPFGEVGEMTMVPGYAKPGAEPPVKVPPADPFGDIGEPTLAPGYAGGAAAQQPGAAQPAAPSANPFELDSGELTMAPGYAGGAQASPPAGGKPNPFDDVGDLTMAPGYAQPGGASPAGGVADPFDFDPSDLTMAPGYAQAGAGPAAPGDLTMAPGYAQPGGAGLDTPSPAAGGPAPGPELDSAGVIFDPEGPTLQGGPTPRPALPEGDAFGSAVMEDPFGQATPPPAVQGAGGRTAQLQADSDFRDERTLVDMGGDISAMANLAATDDHLAIPAQAAAGRRPPVRPSGAALPATGPGLSPRPPAARPLFAQVRPDGQGGVVCAQPGPGVSIDTRRGMLYAPPVAGGWTGVPASLLVLDDGAVLGRVQAVDESTVCVPAALEGDQVSLRLPEGTRVDPRTRAVLIPTSAGDATTWRPPHTVHTEAGWVFFLPAAATQGDDGSWTIPVASDTSSAASRRHGPEVDRSSYYGLVEHVHEDGWTRVELPEGAVISGGSLTLPASGRWQGSPPPLLRREIDAEGRVVLDWPPGVREEGGELWLPPTSEPSEHPPLLVELTGEVRDVQEYLGMRDELLEDGSIRLHLPAGARVRDGWLYLPAEYASTGDSEALLEFERTGDGWFRFQLPDDAEALGAVILIPAAGAAGATAPAVLEISTPTVSETSKPDDRPKTTRVKALDRFRGGKKPKDDVMTFDGVLHADSETPRADADDAQADVDDAQADAEEEKADVDDAQADAEEEKPDVDDAQADGEEEQADADDAQSDDEEARSKGEDDDAQEGSDAEEAKDDADEGQADSDSAKNTKKKSRRRSRRRKKKT